MSSLKEKLKNLILEKARLEEEIQKLMEDNKVSPSAINMNIISLKESEYRELEYEEIDINRDIKYDINKEGLSPYDKGCLMLQKTQDLFDEFKSLDDDIYHNSRKRSLASKIEKNILYAIAYSFADYKMFLILGKIQTDIYEAFDYYTAGMVLYKYSQNKTDDDPGLLSRINIIDNVIAESVEIEQNIDIFLKSIRKNDYIYLSKNENFMYQNSSRNYIFVNRDELIKNIANCFDVEGIKDFCFILGIDYEELVQNPKNTFIRELLNLVKRENKYEELIRILGRERDFIDWRQYIQLEKNK